MTKAGFAVIGCDGIIFAAIRQRNRAVRQKGLPIARRRRQHRAT
ncbi:hypothetical protein [Novosphingobium sp.]|nr:hypothetical protein [Novosphingobium sp.]